MKKSPFSPFLTFRSIIESAGSEESVSDWEQIHPPQPTQSYGYGQLGTNSYFVIPGDDLNVINVFDDPAHKQGYRDEMLLCCIGHQ
jgi:hypothetical protein